MKILRSALVGLVSLCFATAAAAQTYPSPTFNNVTVNGSLNGSGVKFTPFGTGAVSQTVLNRLKSTINIYDFAGPNDTIGDGTFNASPALQKAIDACSYCIIEIPPIDPRTGTPVVAYNLATAITGHGNMLIKGTTLANNHLNAPSGGSAFKMGQSGAPMFTFPGSTSLDAEVSVGWGFDGIRFECNNVNQPAIFSPENTPGRGAWGAVIKNNVFHQCRPAIYAENGWDWWVEDNAFNQTGDGASGTISRRAALYIYGSDNVGTGMGSNSWRITGNTFDTITGQGINIDSTGPGQAVTFMHIEGNHFGPISATGYESIYGCLTLSNIIGNLSEGSIGRPIFDLLGHRNECGRNRIIGNNLSAPGTFSIRDAGVLETIMGNTFLAPGSGGAYVNLTATSSLNFVQYNVHNDPTTYPTVLDQGTTNTIGNNNGSEANVVNGFQPQKLHGTQYYVPLFTSSAQKIDGNWTAYTPTVSCFSGSLTSGTASGAYKQIGKTVFVNISISITTVGTCAGLLVTTPTNAFYAAVVPGQEYSTSGKTASGYLSGATNQMFIRLADGSTTLASGNAFQMSGTYPSQ